MVGAPEGRLGGAAEPEEQARRGPDGRERLDQLAQVGRPRRRVELQHQRVIVAVHHDPRQAVVLAVDEPVAGRGAGAERLAQAHRLGQPGLEPRPVDRRRAVALEDAHANRGVRVVESDGEEAVAAVVDDRQVAGVPLAALLADRLGVEPRMALADPPLRLGRHAQADALVGGRGELAEELECVSRRHGALTLA